MLEWTVEWGAKVSLDAYIEQWQQEEKTTHMAKGVFQMDPMWAAAVQQQQKGAPAMVVPASYLGTTVVA